MNASSALSSQPAARAAAPSARPASRLDELVSPVEERLFGAAFARGPRTLTIYASDSRKAPIVLDYAELLARGRGAASGLQVEAGQPFLLLATSELETIATFFGGLLKGALPVPVSPPAGLGGLSGWRERLQETAASVGAEVVVGPCRLEGLIEGALPYLVTEDLPLSGPGLPGVDPQISHLQLTSGSTAAPKGVRVSHSNLEANLFHIGWGSDVQGDDVVVSWLPLFHDMGLVGCLLFALYWNLELVLMPPGAFITRPRRWLQALSEHGGTLSPAPAFAFPYVARRLRPGQLEGLDLSRWRVAYCGAEPIHATALRSFVEALAPAGLAPGTVLPCYGLAEATLAVSFNPVGRGLTCREVSLAALERGELRLARAGEGSTEVVLLGPALPEVLVEVRDERGAVCGPGVLGEVFLSGPTITPGYHGREASGAWLKTGDLGGWLEGELVLVGRVKDVIIARGRNLAPVELERAAETVEGVRPGTAVAFAAPDPTTGTEEAVVACEVRKRESDWSRGAIACLVETAIVERLGLKPREVLLVAPGAVPKTTSGKVQRARARALYERGELGRTGKEST